jgi:N-acyl homoserine lactone hydrolase
MKHAPDSPRRDRIAALDCLNLGLFDVGPGKRLIPISAWLLTTETGRRILLDTGFPPAYATDGAKMAGADGLASFGNLVDFGPQHTILGALAIHGVKAGDVGQVILSHSHIDHVGGLDCFADAEIILTNTERALPRPLYFGQSRPMEWPKARYTTIEKTTQVCHGLRLYPTPGHTPGHLSALVKLPGAALVLAIDAINRRSEPSEGYPDAMDPVAASKSGQMLIRLARRHGASLIPGHEPVGAADRKAPK